MKTVIMAALVTVSMTFTASANLPPNSGSPDWAEIEMLLNAALETEETVCEHALPNADRTAIPPPVITDIQVAAQEFHPARRCSPRMPSGVRGRSDLRPARTAQST